MAAVGISERLRLIVSKGRAAGITPILCTQKPDSSVIPTGIRDLCSTRIALRCGTEAQAITILADAAVRELGATAHRIGTDTPGMAYLTGEEGADATRMRSFFLDDEAMEILPERAKRVAAGFPAFDDDGSSPALVEPASLYATLLARLTEALEPLRCRLEPLRARLGRGGSEEEGKDAASTLVAEEPVPPAPSPIHSFDPSAHPMPPRPTAEPLPDPPRFAAPVDYLAGFDLGGGSISDDPVPSPHSEPKVVFGCAKHHNLRGEDAIRVARKCANCVGDDVWG